MTDRFADYLRARAAEIRPSAVCEEAMESSLVFKVTAAEVVAKERSIENVFFDPDPRKRREIFAKRLSRNRFGMTAWGLGSRGKS